MALSSFSLVPAKGDLKVIDDQKILRQIPTRVGALVDKKKTLAWGKLVEQLKRSSVSLKLPKAGAAPIDDLYNGRVDSVVAIASVYKCSRCTKWHSSGAASAWVLTADGVMVTNYHVFGDKERAGFVAHAHVVTPREIKVTYVETSCRRKS